MIDGYFDSYGRQARLFPALLALFPVFVTTAVWAPNLYATAAGFVGLAAACGLLTALAHLARTRGRKTEKQLFEEWGGPPTTIWLRRSDHHLETETKKRYYEFFEGNIQGWKAPSLESESADRAEADRTYNSATRWLLEHTRDKKIFSLVFAENVSYGFRRNAFGLKPMAVVICLLTASFSSIGFCREYSENMISSQAPQIAALIVTLLLLTWWLSTVTSVWVRDAGDAFAKALLGACDRISAGRP